MVGWIRRVWVIGFLTTGIAAHATAVYGQSDQVINQKGTPTAGTVTAMTSDDVTVSAGGSDRKFVITDIKRLQFGDEPQELRRARESVTGGQLEAALEDLRKVNPDTIKREMTRLDYDFYKAYCEGKLALSGGGDKQAAVTALRAFVAATKGNNYHAYEAAELLGDLAVAMESYDNAAKFYAFLGRSTIPEYQMRSGVLEGRALLAQKKVSEALQKYESVIANPVTDASANRQKLLATVGKAVCLAEGGKPEDGLKLVEDIIAKNDSQEISLFANAYNAMGICHLRANRPKDALLAFLHVDLLFRGDVDAHAESLYYLTKLWSDLNNSDRSVKARTELTSRYAGSVWAKKQ